MFNHYNEIIKVQMSSRHGSTAGGNFYTHEMKRKYCKNHQHTSKTIQNTFYMLSYFHEDEAL